MFELGEEGEFTFPSDEWSTDELVTEPTAEGDQPKIVYYGAIVFIFETLTR